jgi:hypothetical protein
VQTCESMVGAIHGRATLDRIAEPVAMAAGEKSAAAIELGDPPAAVYAIGADVADEPRPLAAEATSRPRNGHALADRLPIFPRRSHPVIETDGIPTARNGYPSR